MADNKGWAESTLNFVKEHWGEMFTLWHIAKGQTPKDDAPPWAKTAASMAGVDYGGEKNPKDEAFFKKVKSCLGNKQDGPRLKFFLSQFTPYAYQLKHKEQWVRQRGRTAFEEWRTILVAMGEPDAIKYLTDFTRDMQRMYLSKCREAMIAPWPFDESDPDHRYALQEALDYGIEQLQSEGAYIPTGTEAALMIQLKNLAKQMGPKSFAVGKDLYDAVKGAMDLAYTQTKDHGPEYVRKGWRTTNRLVSNTATAVETAVVDGAFAALERKQQRMDQAAANRAADWAMLTRPFRFIITKMRG